MVHNNQDRQQYITNLLSETLPSSLTNESQLLKLSLQEEGFFIVLQLNLSNGLKQIINSLDDFQRTEWKELLHNQIVTCFTTMTIEPITLLNLQPFSRMLLLSVDPKIDVATHKSHLKTCFQNLNELLFSSYKTSVNGCFGSFECNFFDIGNSYKKARKLQEYSLIIGIGQSCFYEDFCFDEDYSLIEYQYIHDFDSLLSERNWLSLENLLDHIKMTLVQKTTNNAKATYLYKELYSLTIRYLFGQIGSYDTIIKDLNEGIIMFEHFFDDIDAVHEYYRLILHRIVAVDSSMPYSLHIKKALQIVHSEYMKALSLSNIADTLTISNAYLSRLFKAEVGVNFKEYLTTYRLQMAKELLHSTKKDLTTIGTSIGYSSSTQFIRVFKAHEGQTPKDYRRSLKIH